MFHTGLIYTTLMKRGQVFHEKISKNSGVPGQKIKMVGKSLDNTNNLDSQNTLIKIAFQKICNAYSADFLFILSVGLYTVKSFTTNTSCMIQHSVE